MKIFLWILLITMIQIGLAEKVQSKQIRVVGTANVHGETDPCG